MNKQTAGTEYTFDSQVAFEVAISTGRLSRDPQVENFAGHYMYMGSLYMGSLKTGIDIRHTFKHIETRKYLP